MLSCLCVFVFSFLCVLVSEGRCFFVSLCRVVIVALWFCGVRRCVFVLCRCADVFFCAFVS